MKSVQSYLRSLVCKWYLRSKYRDFALRQMPPGSICAEIGVYRGDFSSRILRVVKPVKLHLIDPWQYETGEVYRTSLFGGENGGNQGELDRIHQKVLERFQWAREAGIVEVHRATSLEASQRFPDHYFDWIYIDGNHLYEFVRQDLEAYFPKVRPGGFIIGDDYGPGGWWQGGVQKAFDEFLTHQPCERVFVRRRQCCIRKK